jgi:hypothetical protein
MEGLGELNSQWIPFNRDHHFRVINHMLPPFGRFLLWLKPDVLTICGQLEDAAGDPADTKSMWLFRQFCTKIGMLR